MKLDDRLARYCAIFRLWLVQHIAPELDLEVDRRLRRPRIQLRTAAATEPIEFILESIERSLAAALPLPALLTALAVPDILGTIAAGSPASGAKYSTWFDTNVRRDIGLDGAACYALRCKMFHEGTLDVAAAKVWQHSRYFGRVNTLIITIDGALRMQMDLGPTVVIDSHLLCESLVEAARSWLAAATTAQREALRRGFRQMDNVVAENFTASNAHFLATQP